MVFYVIKSPSGYYLEDTIYLSFTPDILDSLFFKTLSSARAFADTIDFDLVVKKVSLREVSI